MPFRFGRGASVRGSQVIAGAVAIIISLTETTNVLKVWGNIFLLSYPYFVASAAIAGIVSAASERIGWQGPLLVLPVMFGVYHSCKRYFTTDTGAAPAALARAKVASDRKSTRLNSSHVA